jgi:hypothetical protein
MGEWIYALVGGEWSASRPGRFTPGERASRYPLDRTLDDAEKETFLSLPGLELRPHGRSTRSQSLYRVLVINLKELTQN